MRYPAHALLCLVFILTTVDVGCQGPSAITFICDASGSMWGRIGDRTKMEVATDVLASVNAGLPADQGVALVAYGHRQKEDCLDVEFLIRPASTDRGQFRETVARLKPLGKTPLAHSARLVIDHLRETAQPGTIILVTDGIESCNGDLCAVVRQAVEEGITFRLHIVGFGLKPEETGELRCAAEAGGGTYFDAADAEGLAGVLTEATATPVKEPTRSLRVTARKNGQPVDANIQVMKPGEARPVAAGRTYRDTAFIAVAPGTWDLLASPLEDSDVKPVRISGVIIQEGEVSYRDVSFDGGTFRVTTTNNGEGWDAMVHIYPSGEGKKAAAAARTYGRPDDQEVNPGVYDMEITAMRLEGNGIKHRINGLAITAGQILEVSHDFQSGTVRVGVSASDGLVDALVHFADPVTGKNLASGRTYTSASSNPKTFLLTPGTYSVTVTGLGKYKSGKKSTTLTVKAGETIDHQVSF